MPWISDQEYARLKGGQTNARMSAQQAPYGWQPPAPPPGQPPAPPTAQAPVTDRSQPGWEYGAQRPAAPAAPLPWMGTGADTSHMTPEQIAEQQRANQYMAQQNPGWELKDVWRYTGPPEAEKAATAKFQQDWAAGGWKQQAPATQQSAASLQQAPATQQSAASLQQAEQRHPAAVALERAQQAANDQSAAQSLAPRRPAAAGVPMARVGGG